MVDDCYLVPGMLVRVKYGFNVGTQDAVIAGAPYWNGGYRWIKARKWRKNSGRWTKPVRIHVGAIIQALHPAQLAPGALEAMKAEGWGRP